MLQHAQLPYLTNPTLKVAGIIKSIPEHFHVEEIPAYVPSGSGEHLYLWIEKTDISTDYLVRQLSYQLHIPREAVGYAGMKDRRAVTRQWISLPRQCEAKLDQFQLPGFTILETNWHQNKLKTGHLEGNRFRITISECDPTQDSVVAQLLNQIRQSGMLNAYGDQRFGLEDETLQLGHDLLTGKVRRARTPFLKKLSLSAVQSWLFNHYLTRRHSRGELFTVLPGDVMGKWPHGGIFVSEDPAVEQQRFEAREIMFRGPIYGTKMFPAKNVALMRELELLDQLGIATAQFVPFEKIMQGTRRPNLVYLNDLRHEWVDGLLVLDFSLPSGSYATILLRELLKTDQLTEPTPAIGEVGEVAASENDQ
ncbi:MAG: tRNA pseudouridine(13) synthase TruD [Zavarzinella sp.]